METLAEPLLQEGSVSPACRQCGDAHQQLIGKNQLCAQCHHGFVHYPIPAWIKAFGVGLLLVLLFSLYSLSGNFLTGIHFKRGERAAARKNYLTAEKEFDEAVKREPSYTEAKLQLLMASYHNHDLGKMVDTYKRVADDNISSDDLASEVASTLSAAGAYFPSDSISALLERSGDASGNLPEPLLRNYLAHDPKDAYAIMLLASQLFDQKKYLATDSLLNILLAGDPLQYNALLLKAPLKREMGQLDSSFYYVDKLLALNHEDVYALSTRSRSLLKMKRDDDALRTALRANSLDPKNGHALASLALVYNFINEPAKRDALIRQADSDSTMTSAMNYVKDVISGKESFRN